MILHLPIGVSATDLSVKQTSTCFVAEPSVTWPELSVTSKRSCPVKQHIQPGKRVRRLAGSMLEYALWWGGW